ncbi:MAG: hypothetical protein ACRCVN_03310 [Spirochaetia bacterium]
MKANWVSLTMKIVGAVVILAALVLKGFGIWNISMAEVVAGVLALEALVLPIDISKIKAVSHEKS